MSDKFSMKFLNSVLVNDAIKWAEKNLKSNLIERDETAVFDKNLWISAQNECLTNIHEASISETQKIRSLASVFFGMAKGGMDLPFCSSLAAHSVISLDLIFKFASYDQKNHYLKRMLKPDFITAICNSEEGAGTDLKKIKASSDPIDQHHSLINLYKSCATNASDADLVLASVWVKSNTSKDSLGVIILEKSEFTSWSLQQELMGFRTGMTGGIKVKDVKIPIQERLLTAPNEKYGNVAILKRCFDMERLFLGVMISGMLESIETEAVELIKEKELNGFRFSDKQYLQEKLIEIYSIKTSIQMIVEQILADGKFKIENYSKELSLLKMLINEKAIQVIMSYFELVGHKGYLKNNYCQKLIRDFMGLKYFGGTLELQKINLFEDILRSHSVSSTQKIKKVA